MTSRPESTLVNDITLHLITIAGLGLYGRSLKQNLIAILCSRCVSMIQKHLLVTQCLIQTECAKESHSQVSILN